MALGWIINIPINSVCKYFYQSSIKNTETEVIFQVITDKFNADKICRPLIRDTFFPITITIIIIIFNILTITGYNK